MYWGSDREGSRRGLFGKVLQSFLRFEESVVYRHLLWEEKRLEKFIINQSPQFSASFKKEEEKKQ